MKRTHDQTLGEEIANAVSHGLMALFGIVAMVLLLIRSDRPAETVASIVFGFSIIQLYLMSTLYHALHHPLAKGVFQRFDHLSIYILIGGTFTPALLLLPALTEPVLGPLGGGHLLLIVQWSLITLGVVFKAIWIKRFQKIHLAVYLALGWSALTFVRELHMFDQRAFWLILAGGLSYTVGVIFYSFPRIRYFHFVWHIFTGIGTVLHFIGIYTTLY